MNDQPERKLKCHLCSAESGISFIRVYFKADQKKRESKVRTRFICMRCFVLKVITWETKDKSLNSEMQDD